MSAPCLKCGTETEERVGFTGKLDGQVFVCDGCLDVALVEFAEHQRQFQELVDSGVPRDQANTIMIDRIDGKAAS